MGRTRARSDDAKRARRQFILATADQLLRHERFDAFTMNKLAAATDLAKGTLYLYFATREELVLALYTDLHDGWIHRFIAAEKQMVTHQIMMLYAFVFTSHLLLMPCLLIWRRG